MSLRGTSGHVRGRVVVDETDLASTSTTMQESMLPRRKRGVHLEEPKNHGGLPRIQTGLPKGSTCSECSRMLTLFLPMWCLLVLLPSVWVRVPFVYVIALLRREESSTNIATSRMNIVPARRTLVRAAIFRAPRGAGPPIYCTAPWQRGSDPGVKNEKRSHWRYL